MEAGRWGTGRLGDGGWEVQEIEAGRWGRGRLGDGYRKMMEKRDGSLGPHPTPLGSGVRGGKGPGPQDFFQSLPGSWRRGKPRWVDFLGAEGTPFLPPHPSLAHVPDPCRAPGPGGSSHIPARHPTQSRTHTAYPGGMPPTPSHSPWPGAHIHSPSLLTWATTPPSYWSPQHQPDLLLLQLGPSPSTAGNKHLPTSPPPHPTPSLPSPIDDSGTHPFSQCAHSPCPAGCNAAYALTHPKSNAPA